MFALPQEPGIHKLEDPQDGSRVTLSIPGGKNSQSANGLVVALHYGGPVTPFYGSGLLGGIIEQGLDNLGAIIAAPDCKAGVWHNVESEKQVCELLIALKAFYDIPDGKTLLTGYSIGGIGSWYIGGRNQNQFAAAMPIAANPPAEVTEWTWSIPLQVIHGRRDELFPIELVQNCVLELSGQGVDISLVEVPEATHFQMGRYVRPIREAVPWIQRCWS